MSNVHWQWHHGLPPGYKETHSVGPWSFDARTRVVNDADGYEVAQVLSPKPQQDGACIAAATEMLALLRETLRPGAYGARSTLADRISALVAKVEG